MVLVVRCALFVVFGLVLVVCCSVVCCSLFVVVYSVLCVVCCSLSVLFVAGRSLFVACNLMIGIVC